MNEISLKARTYNLFLAAVANNAHLMEPLKSHPPFQIIMAGVSETAGPVIHGMSNIEEGGFAPFVLHEYPFGVAFGHSMPVETYGEIIVAGGLEKCGVDWLKRLRSLRDEKAAAVIGGHVDFTTVTADDVETTTLFRWDDQIGDSLGSQYDPISEQKLTRKQRRAMEAQKRHRMTS